MSKNENDSRLVSIIRLPGFLSFSSKCRGVFLENLNIIVGPNASGKSNLFLAFELLRASVNEGIDEFLVANGGARTLQNYNCKDTDPTVAVWLPSELEKFSFTYQLSIKPKMSDPSMFSEILVLIDESNPEEQVHLASASSWRKEYKHRRCYYNPLSSLVDDQPKFSLGQQLFDYEKDEYTDNAKSLISQISHDDDEACPYVTNRLRGVWINRDLANDVVKNAGTPQSSDFPRGFLMENCKNLGVVLNELHKNLAVWNQILSYMRRLLPNFGDVHIDLHSRNVEIFMIEKGMDEPIPASRMSEGTLRFLCLLALLLHPKPPGMICLEEPEVGLHPGVIHLVAELLIKASETTQLIVTTHSDALVEAIGNHQPEAIMICEMGEDGTEITRPDPKVLSTWMEKYSLGELWLSGELGGTP